MLKVSIYDIIMKNDRKVQRIIMKKDYLALMREGKPLTLSERIFMIITLSIPAILAQVSSIVMQYIDASMVGRLGANDSASIGLVSSSTWLFGGLCMAAGTGFSVLIAQRIGANNTRDARTLVKTGLISVIIFSIALLLIGISISRVLPILLGGEKEIQDGAFWYFLIFSLSVPFMQINYTAGSMIQASGNMKVAGMMEIIMCMLDVVFNALLIFPSGTRVVFGRNIYIIGAGLGIKGAALGTALAEAVTGLILLWYLLTQSESLKIRKNEKSGFSFHELKSSLKIAIPVAIEQIITCSAYIAFTRIVSPLGTIAIAANSFSITAESLCYMPGYGIAAAASTIIGQSIGSKRKDLTKKLGWLSVATGMTVMTLGGVIMFLAAPLMIGLLTPDKNIQALGCEILRIEAFAEPMYAASIVAAGVFRGAGDTTVPSVLNLVSMWIIRIPLAAFLASGYGIQGVWIAMCIELCIRGTLFLILLAKRFCKRADKGVYLTS